MGAWLSVAHDGLEELSSTDASLSPLTAAMVSVESQLSCSVASEGPTGPTEEPASGGLLLEAGAGLPPSAGISVSSAVFVHWRAFFFRVNRLIRPGSLKKMLFFTLSPRT